MYTVENLPLLIDLDVKPYTQHPDIEFIDAVVVQKNLISSAMALPFSLGDPKKMAAKFSLSVPSPLSKVCANSFSAPETTNESFVFPWSELRAIDRSQGLKIESSVSDESHLLAMPWGKLIAIDEQRAFSYESAKRSHDDANTIGINSHLNIRTRVLETPQFTVDVYAVRESEYDLRQRDLFTSLSTLIDFDESLYLPSSNIGWGDYKLSKKAAVPLATAAATTAYQPLAKSDLTKLPWGVGVSLYYSPELPYLVESEVIVPGNEPEANKQEVYIIMNNVNVKSLPGNEPLDVADIKIDLDEDSCSWKFSAAVLNQQSVELMKPNENGFKEIEVSINGHVWVFFINTWQRSKGISGNELDKKYQVSGYSRTQYLGEPYAPKRTKSIGSTTAVQAAGEELVGTGFVLNWDVADLPDWQMQSSVFSYQELTPLQVIKRLASVVGALVLPSMASDALTVIPKDKIAPWDLAVATIDRTIHENQILTDGGTRKPRAKINAVRVSGEHQGVDMNITRQGTAGDVPGSDVVDAWISAAEANTSRGRAEIADSGDIETYTVELAIPETASQPGLLLPGLYVAVQHKDSVNDYRAKVTAVSISVPGRGLVKVRQNVALQRPVAWEVAV